MKTITTEQFVDFIQSQFQEENRRLTIQWKTAKLDVESKESALRSTSERLKTLTRIREAVATGGLSTDEADAELASARKKEAEARDELDKAKHHLENCEEPYYAEITEMANDGLLDDLDDIDNDWPDPSAMRKALAHIDGAIVCETLSELFASIPASIQFDRDSGIPTLASLQLGRGKTIEIPIEPTKRVGRSHRPEDLRWVHSEAQHPAPHHHYPDILAIVEAESRCLMSRTEYSYMRAISEQERWYNSSSATSTQIDVDFSTYAEDLEELLESELIQIDALSLTATYKTGSLAKHIQQKVLDETTESVRFGKCKAQKTSDQIAQEIKPHWALITQSPWSRALQGPMAMLKYLLENGERPRFWNEPTQGHYGFRIRTRDHEWLVGNIFIDTDPAPSGTVIEVLKQNHEGTIARIGGLHLLVKRPER